MSKYTITIKEEGSNTTKVHQVEAFNIQLIEKRDKKGIVYKNHREDVSSSEMGMMIIDLMKKYPDLALSILGNLRQENKRSK